MIFVNLSLVTWCQEEWPIVDQNVIPLMKKETDLVDLVHFLCRVASLGYAKTKKEVMAIVEEIVAGKGKEVHVLNGWWESFCKRHPIVALRTAEKLARLAATDPQIISSYLTF